MKMQLVQKARIGLGSTLAILMIIGFASYRTIVESRAMTRALENAHETLSHLANALSALESIQAGCRGFALTGQETFLATRDVDRRRVADSEAVLRSLVADDSRQQRRLATLEQLSGQRIAHADQVVRLRRTRGIEAAAALVGNGEAVWLMNGTRAISQEMEQGATRALAERNADATARSGRARTILIVGTAFGLLVAGIGGGVVHTFGARARAPDEVGDHGSRDGVIAAGPGEGRSEARFRALLESAPDAMVIVDGHGHIELANAQIERLFGYTRPELIGASAEILVPERFRGHHDPRGEQRQGFFQSPLQRAMGEGSELFGLRKDGTEFPVEISLSPLEDASGSSVTAAIRDITDRKRAEQHLVQTIAELKRSNDELEQFAYVTSHDLQEPLRMVASYTQLLAKRYKGRLDGDADEFIAFAVDGSTRMRRLIQDLLAYSRAGTSGEPPGDIASEDALREAIVNLEGAIQEGAAVVTHDPLPNVTMNHLQMVQIFQNLIGNAIKYRGADAPRIHVTAHSLNGKGHVFSVQDNGLGIDPQQFERIFIIFQRLHGRNAFTGTGLGLAICKKLVERQGGRIWVDSEPGHGSTFHFALPKGDTS